jgi:hypothetical protein
MAEPIWQAIVHDCTYGRADGQGAKSAGLAGCHRIKTQDDGFPFIERIFADAGY